MIIRNIILINDMNGYTYLYIKDFYNYFLYKLFNVLNLKYLFLI